MVSSLQKTDQSRSKVRHFVPKKDETKTFKVEFVVLFNSSGGANKTTRARSDEKECRVLDKSDEENDKTADKEVKKSGQNGKDLNLQLTNKGGKFLKKLWCCVGGNITR